MSAFLSLQMPLLVPAWKCCFSLRIFFALLGSSLNESCHDMYCYLLSFNSAGFFNLFVQVQVHIKGQLGSDLMFLFYTLDVKFKGLWFASLLTWHLQQKASPPKFQCCWKYFSICGHHRLVGGAETSVFRKGSLKDMALAGFLYFLVSPHHHSARLLHPHSMING